MRISDWSSDVCSSDLSGGDRIERPKRHPARQPVEQAHPGQAGLADLRRADEVEIADARRLLRRALIFHDDSEAPRPGRKEIADFPPAVAKMTPRVGLRDHAPGFLMGPPARPPPRQHDGTASVMERAGRSG